MSFRIPKLARRCYTFVPVMIKTWTVYPDKEEYLRKQVIQIFNDLAVNDSKLHAGGGGGGRGSHNIYADCLNDA